MDTSEQYIEMCKAATEIQGQWQPVKCDTFANTGPDLKWRVLRCRSTPDYLTKYPMSYVWLPHQDQLQEMLEFPVGCFNDNFWSALYNLKDYAVNECFLTYIPLTMEQLWLAFVMKERHGKVWDGEAWQLG